jgi:hypothetical protein
MPPNSGAGVSVCSAEPEYLSRHPKRSMLLERYCWSPLLEGYWTTWIFGWSCGCFSSQLAPRLKSVTMSALEHRGDNLVSFQDLASLSGSDSSQPAHWQLQAFSKSGMESD